MALLRLQIQNDGDHLSIHAWGKCSGGAASECDWGTNPGAFKGNLLTGDIPLDGRVLSLSLEPVDGQLKVSITNTFSGGRINHAQLKFVKAP